MGRATTRGSGAGWLRVVPQQNGAGISSAIVGIQFADSLHGTLGTAADGVWTTQDGGA